MIRVLQVFGRMDRGGSETMIMNLYRNIDRSKIQFDFVVHTDEKCAFDDEINALGGRIFSVPRLSIKNALKYKSSWKKLLLGHPEWNIIHGHMMSSASIYLSIAQKLGRYSISHSHSVSAGTGKKAFVKRLLENRIKADYYMACSKAAGRFLFGDKIVNSDLFMVLPNAICTKDYVFDNNKREVVRKNLNLTDEVVIGHVGNFSTVKNHEFLIVLFSEVLKKGYNAKLMLVGDGYLRKKIESQIHSLDLEHKVILTGVRSDVNKLLQAMDVFVFPSKFEGLPVSVVEAQATGLPCIISDTIPEEVILTDLVTVISLDDPTTDWVTYIVNSKSYDRNEYAEIVSQQGYDISVTARWLEEFYIEKSK